MAPRSELAMRRTCTCIYHFLVWSWYLFLNYYISQQGGDQRKSKIFLNGGQWKYLTFLNLLLQAIFYGVACVEDVLKRIKGERDLKFVTAFRDLLFTTLAFPISTFVFLSFWILFLYDRELVYPKALDGIFPEWLNHAMVLVLPSRRTFLQDTALLDGVSTYPHAARPWHGFLARRRFSVLSFEFSALPFLSLSRSNGHIRVHGRLLCRLVPKSRPLWCPSSDRTFLRAAPSHLQVLMRFIHFLEGFRK
ncbi:androgen-dependent TFPI-regulating protein isoform X1 [Panthera uncia]|uniref:androgen-dependent TFPI-regulating protein isoform X1 n=1 Tax=Panthera uncia TaxID=29064 RepID=UPI0020FF9323|nr:androgen-dependent TFPI-regulating protein isoform X1 [Panthera uncia]